MMNVIYWEDDCIYNEIKKEDFDKGVDFEVVWCMGNVVDFIFIWDD